MQHAWHDLMFTLFNVPVSLNYNKDPKNFKVRVISCMPIKPAHAFQAFQKEREGVIIKARENARGNHVLCLTKSLNFKVLIYQIVFFAFHLVYHLTALLYGNRNSNSK